MTKNREQKKNGLDKNFLAKDRKKSDKKGILKANVFSLAIQRQIKNRTVRLK